MDYKYGVALIDYNSGERTCKYIRDFLTVVDVKPEIIVIIDNYIADNSSFNIIKDMLDSPRKQTSLNGICNYEIVGSIGGIRVILAKANENLGYARANNLAAKYISKTKDIKYILFSNSDIVFEKGAFHLSAMMKKLDEDNTILGIGSDVINLKGERQSPCKYLSLQDRYWRGILFWPLLKKVYKPISEIVDDPTKEQPVYRLIGAFFMVNINNFNDIDGFDDHTFLYAEELILAERAKKSGYYMFFIPGLKVNHEDGFTARSKQKVFNGSQWKRKLESDLYYYKKYVHVSNLQCAITKAIVNSYIFKRTLAAKILKH